MSKIKQHNQKRPKKITLPPEFNIQGVDYFITSTCLNTNIVKFKRKEDNKEYSMEWEKLLLKINLYL